MAALVETLRRVPLLLRLITGRRRRQCGGDQAVHRRQPAAGGSHRRHRSVRKHQAALGCHHHSELLHHRPHDDRPLHQPRLGDTTEPHFLRRLHNVSGGAGGDDAAPSGSRFPRSDLHTDLSPEVARRSAGLTVALRLTPSASSRISPERGRTVGYNNSNAAPAGTLDPDAASSVSRRGYRPASGPMRRWRVLSGMPRESFS